MKKQILALLLVMTMLIGILPMNLFITTVDASSLVTSGQQTNSLEPNSVNKSGATEPAIVAGYTTAASTEEIKI